MRTAGEPRLLLSAYQCGPEMGSVSQIGWEWYRRMAYRVPTTLFTHVRNRAALERAGAPLGDSEVAYVDTERFAGPLWRSARRLFPDREHAVFLLSSLDFFAYDAMVVRQAHRRRRQGAQWDVVHQVTPVTPAAPTRLHTLGRPVVLGPINGGLGTPAGFPRILRRESHWLHRLRVLARFVDAAWGSTRRATVLLTATEATRRAIPRRYRDRFVPLVENGVDPDRFRFVPWPEAPSTDVPERVLFVGRLVPVKGLSMLLEAIGRVRRTQAIELRVVGDGPMRREWEEQAAALGLADVVTFLGTLPLDEVAREMQRAHLLCLPSVRESGGAVLLEAMATGRPVVAVAFGGPAEIVDETVGRAIAPEGPEFVTAELCEALVDVARHPEAWRGRGEEARRVALRRYTWDAKVERVLRLYREVTAPPVETDGALVVDDASVAETSA